MTLAVKSGKADFMPVYLAMACCSLNQCRTAVCGMLRLLKASLSMESDQERNLPCLIWLGSSLNACMTTRTN